MAGVNKIHELNHCHVCTMFLILWMNENLEFKARNLMFEDLPEMDFTSTMTVPFMAGLIENLKKENAVTFPNKFSSRW